MSGRLDSSRIPPRGRLARATGREEKASQFCVMREKQDVRASCCVTWFGAHLKDTDVHSRLDDLKAEKVRWQSLLAAMDGTSHAHLRHGRISYLASMQGQWWGTRFVPVEISHHKRPTSTFHAHRSRLRSTIDPLVSWSDGSRVWQKTLYFCAGPAVSSVSGQ